MSDTSATPAGRAAGVMVLGVHRSGTSAVTRALALQGLAMCEPDELVQPDVANTSGYWESRRLLKFNDVLLSALGGGWRCPPTNAHRARRRLQGYRSRAVELFDVVYRVEPWVWKDPRNCALLPFWRTTLDRPIVGLVVLRHPEEIAGSLLTRKEHIPHDESLALWERNLRLLLKHAAGMPVLVVRFDDLFDDPGAWVHTVGGFLGRHGIALGHDTEAVERFLEPELRHQRQRSASLDMKGATAEQRALWELARSLQGPHDHFAAPRLPRESRSTRQLLGRNVPGRAKRFAAVSYRELRRRGVPLPPRDAAPVAK